MLRDINRNTPIWRLLIPSRVAVLALLSMTACSGSGDGQFVPGGNGEVTILPSYGYQISAIPGVGPLIVNVPGPGGMLGVSVDFGNTLNGVVNINVDINNYISIIDYSLQSPSTMSVDSDVGVAFLGAFNIEVIQDLQIPFDSPPTTGAFDVVTATETVTVDLVAGGVELAFGGAAPVFFSWNDVENLIDDVQALEWQRRAALATQALWFVLDQVFGVTEAFNLIDDGLATVNPLVVACDAFTGAPPAGVINQGESTFTWMGTGSVPGAGDDFQWAFTDCWFDDAGDPVDTLLNGSIDLRDYVELVDAQSILISSGFNEVIFNNFEIADTVENPAGTFTIDPANRITITGGFDMAFVDIP